LRLSREFTPVAVNLLALGNVKKSKLSFAFLSFFRKFAEKLYGYDYTSFMARRLLAVAFATLHKKANGGEINLFTLTY
jgi:hypothetical protein